MKQIFMNYLDNTKKLTTYSLREVLTKMVPQGNQVELNKENNKELIRSSIFLIILCVIGTIFNQCIEIAVKLPYFSGYSHPFKTVFDETVMTNLSSIIVMLIFSLLVPIFTIYYIKNYGENKQKTWFHYFLVFYTLIVCVKKLIETLSLLQNIFSAFIFTVLLMCVYLLILLINITILKISIDECLNGYNENTKDIYGSLNTEVVIGSSTIDVERDETSVVDMSELNAEIDKMNKEESNE